MKNEIFKKMRTMILLLGVTLFFSSFVSSDDDYIIIKVIIYILTINILFLLNNKYNCNNKIYRNLKRSNFKTNL